ncbi:hypothetical protein CFOL_v3_06194 [Cephalotus follicularis]|uniref:Uncharacterized protein n=1 Tax=Cephalotus follicularis TaxID=3775 RepID=A0A1Q3B3S9_CEPFO|nr:hypothetical protein CFOL_v3_06194 [Cephalotus follicularis]
MLLEKTYRTFHASNMLLQQQYRLHEFTKYHELIGSLLIAEQNNELLLQNHENRPTGSACHVEDAIVLARCLAHTLKQVESTAESGRQTIVISKV